MDLFSKCDQIRSLLRIWSDLIKKSLNENFSAVYIHINKIFSLSPFESDDFLREKYPTVSLNLCFKPLILVAYWFLE